MTQKETFFSTELTHSKLSQETKSKMPASKTEKKTIIERGKYERKGGMEMIFEEESEVK